MSKTEMMDIVKFFLLAGGAIWGWKEISKRSTTVRNLLTN